MVPESITVEDRLVGPGRPTFIIAEIGINHEGDVATCMRMIEAAAAAGADAIKLQTIDADSNYVRGTLSHDLFSRSALTREQTAAAFNYARSLGVLPFTTAGDFATLDWVDRLKPAAHKISSGLLSNLPVVAHAAKQGRPLLISTGMATWEDIDECLLVAASAAKGATALFHCVSLYPAPPERLNLAAIAKLQSRYMVPVGYSDHALGVGASVAAVGFGACMIEKHFSLDPSRPSYDHRLSLDQAEFRKMVDLIRQVEVMRGDENRPLHAAELDMARQMRRILVAGIPIAAGEPFTRENVALKRPLRGMTGLTPASYWDVLGKRARRALQLDEAITTEALDG